MNWVLLPATLAALALGPSGSNDSFAGEGYTSAAASSESTAAVDFADKYSWFGGCCHRQPSCCDNLWDGFCHERKRSCGHHGCCAAASRSCCERPACSCGPKLNLNLGSFFHCCRPKCDGGCESKCEKPAVGCCPPKPLFGHGCGRHLDLFGWFRGASGCNDCDSYGHDEGWRNIEKNSDIPTPPMPMPEVDDPAPKPPSSKAAQRWLLPPTLKLLPTTLDM